MFDFLFFIGEQQIDKKLS